MRLAVFSDVHGNLPALELMLADAGTVDGYLSLGDNVDYGPWSNECLDLLATLPNLVVVEGNHERYFRDGRFAGGSPVARAFFEVCYPVFDRFDALVDLPTSCRLGSFVCTHTIDDRYIYPDTAVELTDSYLIGHSHRQFSIHQQPYVLHNPGSVGQNRVLIDLIDYLILDTETMRPDFRSIEYDEQVVINEMRRRKYPDICVRYYAAKRRR